MHERIRQPIARLVRAMLSGLKIWFDDAKHLYSAPLHWTDRQIVLGVAALSLVAVTLAVDDPVRAAFTHVHNPVTDLLAQFGHWFGTGKLTLYLFVIASAATLWIRPLRARPYGMLIGESYVLSGLLTLGIKSLLGRWRPYTGHGSFAFLPLTTGPNEHLSLPSGHATVAFALSSVMAGMVDHRLWKCLWYGFAVVTALSRIYHDQHWLSDVLLSSLIGTSVGVWLLNRHLTTARSASTHA